MPVSSAVVTKLGRTAHALPPQTFAYRPIAEFSLLPRFFDAAFAPKTGASGPIAALSAPI